MVKGACSAGIRLCQQFWPLNLLSFTLSHLIIIIALFKSLSDLRLIHCGKAGFGHFGKIPMQQHNRDGITRSEGSQEISLSIVVPAFNEEAVLPEFHRRLTAILESMNVCIEIIYVNDGSTDGTELILSDLRKTDSRLAILDLSRNFGKEIAMTAGLDHARGEAVVIIDADLQDPPELIPELVKRWREGFDVVYGQRIHREGESFFKRSTATGFYRLMQHVGRVHIPPNTGDFRLLSRRAVDSLNLLRERRRFMKGLFAWIGFPQVAITYQRDPRYAGKTKWNYWALWNFAIEGITSFTDAPLKVSTYIGMAIAGFAFVYGMVIIAKTLIFGAPVPGYPSLMVVILFLGGFQLMGIGLIGEYLGRMFDETKNRPLYLVNAFRPAAITLTQRNWKSKSTGNNNP
jgi:polyisoprenyl-phosphate glycosyltransferase